MREQFGNTWWGQQWLRALADIDFSNRIPRGASYARTGRVESIDYRDNGVTALVRGSRIKPYEVRLSMIQIPYDKIDELWHALYHQPILLVKLLNGALAPEVNELMRTLGVDLFPQRAADMKMSCSCPDWAVPCKHIAATLYMLCRSIDNDPFSIFRFRGVDLEQLIEEQFGTVTAISEDSIPTRSEFYKSRAFDPSNYKELSQLNFDRLADRTEDIFGLLMDSPAFYASSDFKKKYTSIIKRKGKELGRIIKSAKHLDDFLIRPEIPDLNYGDHCILKLENELLVLYGASLQVLFELSPRERLLHHVSVQNAAILMELAMHLIAKGLVLPRLIRDSDGYDILWTPCTLDPLVREIVDQVEGTMALELPKGQLNTYMAISYLITALIHHIEVSNDYGDPFLNLFFTEVTIDFSDPFMSTFPQAIFNWLSLFYLDLSSYCPVLAIEEEEHGSFQIEVKISNPRDPLAVPVILSDYVLEISDQKSLIQLYKELDLLSRFVVQIDSLVNSHGKEKVLLNNRDIVDFLLRIKPILELLGIAVILPVSMKELLQPRSSARISMENSTFQDGFLDLASMLKFDWRLSLGGELLDESSYQNLLKSAGRLVKHKGQYLYLDPKILDRFEKDKKKMASLHVIQKLHLALSEEYEGTALELSTAVREQIQELVKVKTQKVPKLLSAKLRPYQQRGYSWLVKNSKLGLGSIIADDMGLGKTIQVISWICYAVQAEMTKSKRILIIMPTSLLPNWENEIIKFAPHIDVYIHYGANRDIGRLSTESVVLTTYGIARSDASILQKCPWLATIIDEAQNIKNPSTSQTKAIKSINADNYIAMSGTPVENSLLDYWSIMDFTNRGLLASKSGFIKDYIQPIVRDGNQEILQRFNRVTSPFILRRMKTDKSIIADLPDKVVQDVFCHMTVQQSALYQKVLDEALEVIQNQDKSDRHMVFKRQGLILQLILALKQICNHPAQWLKDTDFDTNRSGKLLHLINILETIISAGDKVLIFTQFKQMGDILSEAILFRFGLRSLWLHGGVTLNKRKEMVLRFQNESHEKIMILSLKAGGTGLNLTAANHVIHYDLWWNPAVEQQATDRAFRIGQTKKVFVHRMIIKNSFEEKINALILSKMRLAKLTVSAGEKWIGQLSNQDLEEIFSIH